MKLRTKYAVVSFCLDFTDPEAKSLPVAVLLLGDFGADDECLATAVACKLENVDPLTSAFLDDVPGLLREHMMSAADASTWDEALDQLRDSLRNSLHVSRISRIEEVEVADSLPSVYELVVKMALDKMNSERAAAGMPTMPANFGEEIARHLVAHQVASLPHHGSVGHASNVPSLPQSATWPLPRRVREGRAEAHAC